jgi:hypothetical protein
MRRLQTLLLAGALLLGAAACGDEPSGSAANAPSGTSGTSGTSGSGQPTSTSQAGQLPGRIVLTRTGGIAGMDDALVLNPDGSYTVTRKGQAPVNRRADAAQLAAIATAVQGAELGQLPRGATNGTVSDEIFYKLNVGSRTYLIASTQAPEQVKPLLDELGALFSAPAPTP